MADEKKERAVLIVTSVGSKREPTAGNPVITFGAHKEGEEATAGYEVWGNDLVNLIVKDARLDCEVTHKQKGEQVTLRVTQMFDEKGNPIRQTQRRSDSRGGGSYGKSDEQVRTERISIESQTAYNGIIELLKSKVIELTHTQAVTALDYAEKKMRAGMAPAPIAKEPELKEKTKAEPKTATPSAEDKPDPKVTEAMIEQFKKVATDKGYTQATIDPLIKFFGVQHANELTVSQGKQLLEKLKKGEGLAKTEPLM